MRNRILIVAGIAALVISATVLAIGHGFQERREHGGGPGGHGDMLEHMARELNLTDAQKEQVKTIFASAESSGKDIHAKLEEIHKQLDAATANGQFDEAQVRTLANQQAQLEADMMVEHLRAKSKVFAILTAEQRVKAEEMHKQMGPMRRHGPPPPPPSEQ
ncbi:MAG TPA: Spy/CpxP family protein refolding chaperone [Pyrinomonadaceae bacterium]|jgi:protein CpxP|nr:Spy/CpxP family protein refolding chaperone [Pyrinomonadaceae bacterium]